MSQNKQITENIINTIAKHPYLSMFLVCLMANLLCFGSEGNVPQNTLGIKDIVRKILFAMVVLNAVMGTYIWMVICYNTRG